MATDLSKSASPSDGKYFGPCPWCGTQLGFGHEPEECDDNPKAAEPRRAEREMFEYWCREVMLCDPDNLERLTGGKGSYRLHNVQCWWMGWQAARASAALPSPGAQLPSEEVLQEAIAASTEIHKLRCGLATHTHPQNGCQFEIAYDAQIIQRAINRSAERTSAVAPGMSASELGKQFCADMIDNLKRSGGDQALKNALRELLDAANLVSYEECPSDADGERYEAARLNAAKTLAASGNPSKGKSNGD